MRRSNKNQPHAGDGGNISAHCRRRRQTLTIAAIAEHGKQLPPMAAANINHCRVAVDGGGKHSLLKEREREGRNEPSPYSLSIRKETPTQKNEPARRIKFTPRGGWADRTLCRECNRHPRVKPHPNCARCMAETARVMGRWSKAAHFAGVTQ